MPTKLLFRTTHTLTAHRGSNDSKLDGSAAGWNQQELLTTQGAAAGSVSVSTVAGPTSGIELAVGSGVPLEWLSPPLAAGVTISGTITYNIRCAESAMAVNAGAQVVIERVDNTGAIISTVSNKEFGTEASVTTERADNFTDAAPASTTFNKGDRIRARVAANDAGGTMAAGTFTFWLNGAAGATGDSYVSFTEAITFQTTDPAGSQLFLTEVASGITDQGAGVDEKDLWTSRGSGVTTAVRNTATGFTAPLQWTTSAGGNTIEWYSDPLSSFTLSGLVKCNLRLNESDASADAGANAELSIVSGDGSGASVFGSGGVQVDDGSASTGELGTVEAAVVFYLAGQDISVAAGQRLRLRVRLDDSAGALVTGNTATLFYAGTSGGASGDSWMQVEATLAAVASTLVKPYQYNPIPFYPTPTQRR